jgi:glutathione S-transferase
VRLALALGGVKHQLVDMKLDGDQRAPKFRALTPFGTTPVLVDGKTVVAQSYAALQWLGDKRPSLLPRTGAARARALTWVAASATELDPAVARAYQAAFFTKKPDSQVVDAALTKVREAVDRLEKALAAQGKSPYLAGRAPTIADAAAFPSFWLLQDLADDFPKRVAMKRWPLSAAWYARMKERDEVKAVLARAEE